MHAEINWPCQRKATPSSIRNHFPIAIAQIKFDNNGCVVLYVSKAFQFYGKKICTSR